MAVATQTAAGFVLTGGKSSRMGRDKALLEIGGRPLALRSIELLRPLVAEVALVGAPERYAHLGIPVLADETPGLGPLAGIVTSLAASRREWNLVLACDLPYLQGEFLAFLLERALDTPEADAIVPQSWDGPVAGGVHWQPLCAVYHRRCLAVFQGILAGRHPKISLAFDRIRVDPVTPAALMRFAFSDRLLKNMNTVADYREAQRLLG